MPRMTDMLDKRADEIKRPPNLPVGTYVLQLVEHPTIEDMSNGAYERMDFNFAVVSATDDVDPDELKEYGKVEGSRIRKSFLISTDEEDERGFQIVQNRVKMLLTHLGALEEGSDKSIKEGLSEAVNGQCLGTVTHRADKNDPDVIYQEVGNTAPL